MTALLDMVWAGCWKELSLYLIPVCLYSDKNMEMGVLIMSPDITDVIKTLSSNLLTL